MYIPSPSKYDPDDNGHFGIFGGRYVPETLMPVLLELKEDYEKIRFDEDFWKEVDYYLTDYVGRPSPLYYAANISEELGAKVYLKREDLNHTGAHKVNNVIAQGLIAQRLGKKKVIAETGAGQHGVATATIAALLGLECDIFMGAKDVARQELNVFRMKLLGARVHAVESGSKTLKDAMRYLLYYRYSRRSAPLPYDGTRFSVDHRLGSPCSDLGKRKSSSRSYYRLYRRWIQCHWYVPALS